MNDWLDWLGWFGAIVIGLFWGLVIGVGIAKPQELENGCLVDEGKIYCEKVEVNG